MLFARIDHGETKQGSNLGKERILLNAELVLRKSA